MKIVIPTILLETARWLHSIVSIVLKRLRHPKIKEDLSLVSLDILTTVSIFQIQTVFSKMFPCEFPRVWRSFSSNWANCNFSCSSCSSSCFLRCSSSGFSCLTVRATSFQIRNVFSCKRQLVKVQTNLFR